MTQLAKIFPFIVWFRLTTLETIKADFFAGLTGAIIVLPQSVAFATIAGMPPEYGLYTAMVVPILSFFKDFFCEYKSIFLHKFHHRSF